jgi:hypothetical protein
MYENRTMELVEIILRRKEEAVRQTDTGGESN